MAGYTNNYAGYDSPEYQAKPNADSTNGTYGANTPAARQNQQDYASQARSGGGAPKDPYAAFSESSRNWWPASVPQPAQSQLATQPAPLAPPTALSSLLRGRPRTSPPWMPPVANPVAEATQPKAAQPSGVAIPPAMPPQLPSTIPPVPTMLGGGGLANTIRTASIGAAPPVGASVSVADSPPEVGQASITTPVAGVGSVGGPLPVALSASGAPDALPVTPPATTPADAPPAASDPASDRTRAVVPPPEIGAGVYHPPAGSLPPSVLPTAPSDPRTRPSAPPPIYSDQNPPPHPGPNATLTELGNYYRAFNYKNPAFGNIRDEDILAYQNRASANPSETFGDWYLAGGRAPVDPNPLAGTGMDGGPPGSIFPPATPPGTPPGGDPGYVAPRTETNNYQTVADQNAAALAAAQPGGTTTPPGATPPPVDPNTPPGTTTPGTTPGTPTGQADITDKVGKLYDPLFKQQQTELARTLRAQAALDGSIDSGGFNESLGRAESNLSANQGAQKVALTEAAQNREQAMTIAVMQDATQRFGIKTNDDLQRWLNDPNNNTLQKYGIDKNFLLEQYKANIGLQGAQLQASASYNAAALQAATQAAIAAGNNATQLKLGTMSNDLGWGQLQGNLYNSDQDRYIAELKMLTDAGISSSTIAAILAAFGPSPPIYTTHP